ncbi:MAG: alpha/beta fold hydrolase [Gammaproteobacteria bacterium]
MKKNVLLMPGWGATCKVWESIIPVLSEGCQINCLPPTWSSASEINGSLSHLDDYISNVAALIKAPTNIVAWSMGGLLAIKLANRFPQLVEQICFVSSVPKFVSEDNQNTGIDYQWFNQFVAQYQSQPIATLKGFQTLQVKNDAAARNCLRSLVKASDFENYNLTECGFGLRLLQEDLSEEFIALQCNTCFIHGDADAVVNLKSVEHAAYISNSPLSILSQAGHAPHVSQPDAVARIIKSYLFE